METQVFKSDERPRKMLWQILGGLGILFFLLGAAQSYSADNIIMSGALFLLGSAAIMGVVVYSWINGNAFSVTTNPNSGLTIIRAGKQAEMYKWEEITATELICDEGVPVTFHIFTTYGTDLEVPRTMQSFNYFIDVVNRSAIHLPYTWEYLDWKRAKEMGVAQSWQRIVRKQA